PPMIAIFVDPGGMPALSDEAQNRYERIFEYDSLTPRFANFLIDELVPEVGKSYNLSQDANDHAVAGISTGGVGAFVAAWNRPDQFRRVITWVGSFGNFRGADRLPGLIRRTEPRPIAVREPQSGAGRGIFAELVPHRELLPPPSNPAREGGAGRGGQPATPPPAAGRGGGPRGAVYALIYRDKPWEQVGGLYKSV